MSFQCLAIILKTVLALAQMRFEHCMKMTRVISGLELWPEDSIYMIEEEIVLFSSKEKLINVIKL